MMKFTSVVLSASLLGLSNAECPNACSSHGICTNYDMCQCYRNWMANDCSERVCQFGLAHVDTPKGDLDASSGALAGPGVTVIPNSQVYPYGTTEQFPRMVDSNNGALTNTAHYYMECSNKGICDRQAGVCECFPGYEGSACQRASCPSNSDGVCSGHGTCQSIKELSNNDYNNIYELWDKSATLGCDCDPGYYGADCSLRQCKYGVDPLYVDDGLATPRYANWTYGFYTAPVSPLEITGNYSIVFYDVFGEDWRTDAIQYSDGCDVITDKLENLPNNAVPKESVLCYEYPTPSATLSGKVPPGSYTFRKLVTLVFTGNPGALQQIALDLYLDGPRPTLVSNEATSTLGSFVFANGYHGEFIDYVSDYCEGVEVTLDTTNRYLSGISTPEAILLKRCLGDSDGDETNNAAEIYNWDHGTVTNPHLIKLVETTAHPFTHICNTTNLYYAPLNQLNWCENFKPAGFYLPVYFDGTHFRFVGNLNTVYGTSTTFRVFTTKGRLEKVAEDADIQYHFTQNGPYSNKIAYPDLTGAAGAIDCETRTAAAGSCLNKGDRVMFFNFATVANNPELHNIYTVKRVGRDRDPDDYTPTTMIDLDMGINFGSAATIFAYKFWPATGSSWAAECSDRGVCDSSSGICKCFRGYTSDDCSVQSTLAK